MIIRSSQLSKLDQEYDANLNARLLHAASQIYPAIDTAMLEKMISDVITIASKARIKEEQDILALLDLLVKHNRILSQTFYRNILERYVLAVHLDVRKRLAFLDKQLEDRE